MVNISIVLYQPNWQEVNSLCTQLIQSESVRCVYLVDNSPAESAHNAIESAKIKYLWNEGKNLGYGRAHNIAIRETIWLRTRYHLVMNSDISVQPRDLDALHTFMEKNEKVGLVMPKVVYPTGEVQHLCKLLPTPWDVFSRRFLPKCLTSKRNEHYELQQSGYDTMMNVPYLSGCFMFLRTEAVKQARLFDERYFMYPEDIDLCRTIHRDWLTLYLPSITIVHHHAQASYHSLKMLWIHCVNLCRYFNKWGWLIDQERTLINRITLTQDCLKKKE